LGDVRTLEIKCLGCGGEEFTIRPTETGFEMSCDACEACFGWDFRPERLPKRADAKAPCRCQTTRPARTEFGVVYCISGPGDDAPIKIGHASRSAEERIGVLQTGYPGKLSVLAEIKGGYPLETKLHRLFSEFHLFGEWFRRTPETLFATKLIRSIGEHL
jgi:hypothetical protein